MVRQSPPRRPLHERSDSDSNSNARTLRMVSNSPQFLRPSDDIFARTPLPTHPSHILLPGKGKGKDYALQYEFQHAAKSPSLPDSIGSPVSTAYTLSQPPPPHDPPATPSTPKHKPPPKKRLQIHKDSKTFSLVPQDDAQQLTEYSPQSPRSQTLSTKSSYDLLPSDQHLGAEPESTPPPLPESPPQDDAGPAIHSTPALKPRQEVSANHKTRSPWNYQLVGGIRKVPLTPDVKLHAKETSEQPRLPKPSDTLTSPSHALSTKTSFLSTETSTTTSENANYKVYPGASPVAYEASPTSDSGNSNYQIHGESSPESSVIYRPQTSTSENENYELHGDPSPSTSYVHLSRPDNYSHESLVVPPLNPRAKRSNEDLGYFKSRSRESLRTGSLTSISTVLSQQEAARAVVGSGALINIPNTNPQYKVADSWAELIGSHPLRSHMKERPHQWSSQLSTVHSVSEGGTDRGSRAWSDDHGRRASSGFPSAPSRQSRQMLSISSQEEEEPRSDSIEPPELALLRDRRGVLVEHDEYGDVITDMRDLRSRPSRTRMSAGLYSIASDNGRTSTMRSTASSRANSLLASTIPTWARLYYGSGEWRYLITTPGTASEAGSDSRNNSFRSGSPNTDHFPATLYSPRRRPRDIANEPVSSGRNSFEITPAPEVRRNGRSAARSNRRRDGRSGTVSNPTPFRTWSMSSVWSPHLRQDKRAVRNSVWEAPSLSWSTEGQLFGRRNAQVLLFVGGFVFPFAWMIAAFLPLPLKNPGLDVEKADHDTSDHEQQNGMPNDYSRQFGPLDEARYESARWWRNLNRCMSVVGIIILILLIILAVVGTKKDW